MNFCRLGALKQLMTGLPDDDALDPRRRPRLARDLARIAHAGIEVPPDVERYLMARRRLEQVATRRMRLSRGTWWIAAAVFGALCLGAALFGHRPSRPAPATAAFSGDLDGNGRVDILDAFTLARQLRDGSVAAAGDVNGDGLIDGADVNAIALRAVRLDLGAG